MLTIIDNLAAPTEYPYAVSIPSGGRIQLRDDGGASVLDADGNVILGIDNPWAKDATGAAVPTYFTSDGTVLTQHIDYRTSGVVLPVTADPFLSFINKVFRDVWRGALGCVGGKELAEGGVRKFITWGGAKYVLSRMGTKWVPYVGWVSCGYGAWDGIRG